MSPSPQNASNSKSNCLHKVTDNDNGNELSDLETIWNRLERIALICTNSSTNACPVSRESDSTCKETFLKRFL